MPHGRVIVFGYGELALASLDTLGRLGVTPVAVVVPGNRTSPDVTMVTDHVRSSSLTLLVQPPRARLAPFLAEVRALSPDLLLVWSYSMLLPPDLIALAPRGAINVHGGLLPEYRGGHVMNWAIANGESETGVTLAHIDAGIDTGAVIAEQRFPIEWRDDAASVRQKLKVTGERLLETWWPAIEAGTAPAVAQDESRARYHRMRTAADGRIDWSRSNVEIYNLVRALVAPWPGAFTSIGSARLVLRQVEPVASISPAAPGTVVRCDDEIRISSGGGDVLVRATEVNGRLATIADLRHLGLVEGVRLAFATPETVR